MGSAVGLRGDFSALDLRALARRSGDAAQVRRLLALAVICAGGTRRDAALAGGVGLRTVRDWVLRFNAQGPDGLIGGKAPGKLPLLNGAQREALAGVVEAGPELALHGVVRWRPDLADRRSGGMAAHHIRGHGQPADTEPGVARARLSQAVGATAPPCPGGGGDCRL